MSAGPKQRKARDEARNRVRYLRDVQDTPEAQKGGFLSRIRGRHLDQARTEFLKKNREVRQTEGKPVGKPVKKKKATKSVQSKRTPAQRRKAAHKRVRRLLAASGRDINESEALIGVPGDPEKYGKRELAERKRRLAYQAGKASEVGPVKSPSVTKALQKKGTSKSKLHKGQVLLPFVRRQGRTKGPTARGS